MGTHRPIPQHYLYLHLFIILIIMRSYLVGNIYYVTLVHKFLHMVEELKDVKKCLDYRKKDYIRQMSKPCQN
jgi:hypothetical protein